ncbi:MAG: hypothetical protein ACFFDF_07510, partial [Candidatus Odinarchaeota archaeon]
MPINPTDEKDIDLNYINKNLNILEVLLTKHKISQKREYQEWVNDFKKIYGKKNSNLHLYCIFAVIYLIS